MFNPEFSPYDALVTINENQRILADRQQSQAREIADLVKTIKSQQAQIDILIQGLDMANRANEALMQQLLSQVSQEVSNYSTQGQH